MLWVLQLVVEAYSAPLSLGHCNALMCICSGHQMISNSFIIMAIFAVGIVFTLKGHFIFLVSVGATNGFSQKNDRDAAI